MKQLLALFIGILTIQTLVTASERAEIKEEREVAEFSKIDLEISATVYLRQGKAQKLEIEADEKTLAKIETKVKEGKLKIDTKSSFSNVKGVIVYITVIKLESIEVFGKNNRAGRNCIQRTEY